MNNQKLIIYEFDELYKILIEINNDVNLIIKKTSKNDISYFISQPNTLILTQKKGNKICPAGIAWAKRTFEKYPSAYANMAASKYCKDPNYGKK